VKTIVSVVLFGLTTGSPLFAQAPFYQGKTINIRVGFTAGGAFDVWARIIAQHMGKHVPGNPTLVVQNMTGGGSMIAANYVYSVAKPDGLTLGIVSPGLYIQQLAGQKEVQYDWFKYSWIGSPEKTDRILYIRADSPIKTLEDMRNPAAVPKCAATGVGTAAYYFPRFLQEAFGLKLTMVPGYQGAADANLALEKGEVQCWAATLQAYFGSEPSRTWTKTGFVRVLVQSGAKRDARIADTPTLWEIMDRHKSSDLNRRLAKILLVPDDMGRPFFGPPGVPAERLKALREGFVKMMNDPEVIAEARKKGLDPELISGEEFDAMGKELATPAAEIVQRLRILVDQ